MNGKPRVLMLLVALLVTGVLVAGVSLESLFPSTKPAPSSRAVRSSPPVIPPASTPPEAAPPVVAPPTNPEVQLDQTNTVLVHSRPRRTRRRHVHASPARRSSRSTAHRHTTRTRVVTRTANRARRGSQRVVRRSVVRRPVTVRRAVTVRRPVAVRQPVAVQRPRCGTAPSRLTVSSTAYALRGQMANGENVHQGAVAMNCVPFGTRYSVLDGPRAGQTYTVKDRIGHGSDFDIWMSSRAAAIDYGRRTVTISRVP